MKNTRIKALLLLLLMSTALHAVSTAKQPAGQPVRNVIFMIGDGMGLAHMQSAMMRSEQPLSLERAQFIGLSKTYSANNRVTDSAASGTAMATGHKTNNSSIGVDANNNPVKNMVERAHEAGLATGVVVTKDITDATPAAFMAHRQNRKMADEIADDIASSKVDLFIGGGRKHFEERKDGMELTEKLKKDGYKIAYTLDEVKSVEKGKLAAMLADGHLKKMTEGRGDYLPEATAQALTILKNNNPKGFFLMVEGSQIDSGAHDNDKEVVVAETIDFDKAVGIVFDFADKNPGTLVVVTADHETGGLTLPSGKDDFTVGDQGLLYNFSTKGHTGSMVPVYAYGTGAQDFSTIMENTDLPRKMAELLKLNTK